MVEQVGGGGWWIVLRLLSFFSIVLMVGAVVPANVSATHWLGPSTVDTLCATPSDPAVTAVDGWSGVYHIYVAWSDCGSPQKDIWFRMYTDFQWQNACKVLTTPNDGIRPDVAAWRPYQPGVSPTGAVYVAWAEHTGTYQGQPTYDIMLAKLDSWSPPSCPTWTYGSIASSANEFAPRIAADHEKAHVVWVQDIDGVYQVRHATWDGSTVGPYTTLSNAPSWIAGDPRLGGPDVAVSTLDDSVVNVVWECRSSGAEWEVQTIRSTDGGATWPPASACTAPISGGAGTDSLAPAISDVEKFVHVTWTDYRDPLYAKIYYSRSWDHGDVLWTPERKLDAPISGGYTASGRSDVAACGHACVGVVWQARTGSQTDYDIHFARSYTNGDSWQGGLFPYQLITSGGDDDVTPAIASDRVFYDGGANPPGPCEYGDSARRGYQVVFQRTSGAAVSSVQHMERPSDEVMAPANQCGSVHRWGSSAAHRVSSQYAYIVGGWNNQSGQAECNYRTWDVTSHAVGGPIDFGPGKTACAETSAVSTPEVYFTPDTVLVFGGRTISTISNQILRIVPESSTVLDDTPPGGFTPPRYGTSAVYDGVTHFAYVFGGQSETGYLNEIVLYDTWRGSLTTCAVTFQSGARSHTSAVWDAANRVAYIFGGKGPNGDIDEIIKFDPTATPCQIPATLSPIGYLPDEVEDLGPGVAPRYGTSAVWDPTKEVAYVFGGQCSSAPGCLGGMQFDTILEFATGDIAAPDPQTPCLPLLTARAHTSAVWAGDRAYVFFGNGGPTSLSTILLYKPNGVH